MRRKRTIRRGKAVVDVNIGVARQGRRKDRLKLEAKRLARSGERRVESRK